MTKAPKTITVTISPATQTVKGQCMALTKIAHKMDKTTPRMLIIMTPERSFIGSPLTQDLPVSMSNIA
jgi:hypothetical protein